MHERNVERHTLDEVLTMVDNLPRKLDFSGMTEMQKTKLYLKLVSAMADIVSGDAIDNGLDSSDVSECFKEFTNVIDGLRQNWGAI
jgi:hypothetical protein